MDAILKFKEAAKGLQNDERYMALVAARKANDEDEALQNQIGEFNLLRLEINNEMEKDSRDEDKITEMNTKVNRLYNEIMTNKNMLAYNEAKQDIRGLINHINAIITAAIDGEDPMVVEEPQPAGCGEEGCASCSGCG